jgi:hypothetical protein
MQNLIDEPSQRLNVDLPQSQYFALKSYALYTNQTVSQLVRTALQQVVDYDTWFRSRVEQAQSLARDPSRKIFDEEAWSKLRATKLTNKARQAKTKSTNRPTRSRQVAS